MLRKWLLCSSMVAESRCCQEMLMEGQILNNSIHHCFHNCLHPPSWRLSLVKRRDVLQLLFLAKAASHKLHCNYPSDDDFHHLRHLGHVRSLPSAFKLSMTGQLQARLSPTPSHPPDPLFSFFLSLPRCARQRHPSHDRCWADIKPAVFSFQVRRVARLISRKNLAQRNSARGNVSALGVNSALTAVHPDTHNLFNWLA